MGYSWEVALGAVFLAGIFVFYNECNLRQWVLRSIPFNLRIAMGAVLVYSLELLAKVVE